MEAFLWEEGSRWWSSGASRKRGHRDLGKAVLGPRHSKRCGVHHVAQGSIYSFEFQDSVPTAVSSSFQLTAGRQSPWWDLMSQTMSPWGLSFPKSSLRVESGTAKAHLPQISPL